MRYCVPADCLRIQLRERDGYCCSSRFTGLEDLQARFVAFGRETNCVGDAGVRLQTYGFAVGRRVDDALRKTGVESLRNGSTAGRVHETRSQQAVGIWLHVGKDGVELEIVQTQADGQLLIR